MAEPLRAADQAPAKAAIFLEDPLLLHERTIRESARAHAQEKLLPRV